MQDPEKCCAQIDSGPRANFGSVAVTRPQPSANLVLAMWRAWRASTTVLTDRVCKARRRSKSGISLESVQVILGDILSYLRLAVLPSPS